MNIKKLSRKTSIGNSVRSRPTNKHKRRSWKKYQGQGETNVYFNGSKQN